MEGVIRVDHVPERREGKESGSPVTADLSTDMGEVGYEVGCEGADVGEDLRWEFVDGRERISDRSDGAGSLDQAFFGIDDLMRWISQTFGRGETTGGILGRTSERERLESVLSYTIVSITSAGGTDTDELTHYFERMSRV